MRTQLRLMNGLRGDSAAWEVRRWFRRAAGSVEAQLAQLLEEIHEEVVDVTVHLNRGGPREALSLLLGTPRPCPSLWTQPRRSTP